MDRFYTPPKLADFLVSSCKLSEPKKIADFAAGDGALLKSALARWPNAEFTALDIDNAAIQSISASIPNAILLCHDFFDFSNTIHESDFGFDLIILNPPFSCRGGTTIEAKINGHNIKGSRALAFVSRALEYLHKDGELIAILPSSCLTSERDSAMRTALQENWDINLISPSISYPLPRCSVKIDIVRIIRRERKDVIIPKLMTRKSDMIKGRLQIMRGTLPDKVGSALRNGLPFVHSTNLSKNQILNVTRWSQPNNRMVYGTALLLPRVGKVRLDKVSIKTDPRPIVLSDCVIAIKAIDSLNESDVFDTIRLNWDNFSQLWTGSCAPYLTISRLSNALERFGYEVERVSSMMDDFRLKKIPTDSRSYLESLMKFSSGEIELLSETA